MSAGIATGHLLGPDRKCQTPPALRAGGASAKGALGSAVLKSARQRATRLRTTRLRTTRLRATLHTGRQAGLDRDAQRLQEDNQCGLVLLAKATEGGDRSIGL